MLSQPVLRSSHVKKFRIGYGELKIVELSCSYSRIKIQNQAKHCCMTPLLNIAV